MTILCTVQHIQPSNNPESSVRAGEPPRIATERRIITGSPYLPVGIAFGAIIGAIKYQTSRGCSLTIVTVAFSLSNHTTPTERRREGALPQIPTIP